MGETGSLADFERRSRTLGDLFHDVNFRLGDEQYLSEGNMFPPPAIRYTEADRWNPFTDEEIDRIRHYYWQKMALEEQGSLLGTAVPAWHELAGHEGFLKTLLRGDIEGAEESIYDLYINALAVLDYFLDEGPSGTDMYKKLQDNMSKDEFRSSGKTVLERVGYVPEKSLSLY